MYFSTFTLFVLSHLATVRAQGPTSGFDTLTSPPSGSSFAVGSVLPIVWEAGSSTGTVSILLNGGPTASTLQHLFEIGTSINSQAGGYNWTITSAVGSYATYGLNLTLDGNPITEYQESFPFHLTGGSDTSSSISSTVVDRSTSSSSASGSTASSSASGSTNSESTSTVTAVTTSATTTAADLTPSGTGSTTTLTSTGTLAVITSTPYSNGTASKTSSSKTSSTSSAASTSSSSTGSAANVRPVQFLSASVPLLSACLFAFAL